MTSTADSTYSQMSLDSVFTPPTRKQWVELAVAGLKSSKEDSEALQELQRTTLEGIPLELLYDSAELSFQTTPSINKAENWDNRLCVACSGATAANTSLLQGLAGGITSIELHTSTASDIAPALQGMQLDMAKVSLRSGPYYKPCTDALTALASEQDIATSDLRCHLNADPVGAYLQGFTSAESLHDDLGQMASFAKTTVQSMPLASSILIDAALHHNAGASTVEELHAALATAVLYLEAMLDAGMNVNDASQQIVFQLGMDADVLLGVAKIRALKTLWAHIVQTIDANADPVHAASIVAETSQRYCSTLQPWNNHLRNLAAGTAAVLGGADTLMVHPHDALQRGDSHSDSALGDRMARNIAIILERECGLRKVHDPMAGSYAIENLTQQLMQHVWQSLGSTDTGEGWLDELTSGRWQTRLSNTHQLRITLMKKTQRVVVGVNRFVQTDSTQQAKAATGKQTHSSRLQAVRDSEQFEQQAIAGAAS